MTHVSRLFLFLLFLLPFLFVSTVDAHASDILDTLRFGDAVSEKRHRFRDDRSGSEVVKGGLDEPARILLPPKETDWQGGSVHFTMRVDPNRTNYLTVKLWGGETVDGKLIFYLDGKQLGYRHLGDYDLIDHGGWEQGCPGRFYYTTTLVPPEFTKGRTEIPCEIRSTGRIWGYGGPFEVYQKNMEKPSRGIYAVYSHTDGCFVPPETEKQGAAPQNIPLRENPGPELLDRIKERTNRDVDRSLAAKEPQLNQMQVQWLAQASLVRWSKAFENPAVTPKIVESVDRFYRLYVEDPNNVHQYPETGWLGLGPLGSAVRIKFQEIEPKLGEMIDDGKGKQVNRREAWAEMFRYCVDWHRAHRRWYTNQAMIVDMSIYQANRASLLLDPAKALPEKQALRYLHESIGLAPWSGSDLPDGGKEWKGPEYFQTTKKGLTRELGYVGNYGEILTWASMIYLSTCDLGWFDSDMNCIGGDPDILQHLVKIAHTRSVFRYPAVDNDGFRAMRLQTVIGWRDAQYPGHVTYGSRSTKEGVEIFPPVVTLDERQVGYAQQMLTDKQFFASFEDVLRHGGWRESMTLVMVPGLYEKLTTIPPSSRRLPMSEADDFVWTDEESGVVAIKHKDEILYVNLYWRARYGVNDLARIHAINPNFERIATVRQRCDFEPADGDYVRPDWTDFGFARGGHRYPGEFHSLHEGERLPIVKMPDGVPLKIGDESLYAGRCDFYQLKYGKYLIAMNCTSDKTMHFNPPGFTKAVDLVSGQTLEAPLKLPPRTTVVFNGDFETKLPESPYRSFPHNGAINLPSSGFSLSWLPGERAESYQLYFGTKLDNGKSDYRKIDLKSTSWTTEPLKPNTEYCYRIDSSNAEGTARGEVRRFRTMPIQSGILWTQANIGDVGIPGTSMIAANRITMQVGGDDIWDNADNIHYVNIPLEGNGEIIAQVVMQENSHEWAKAGIMLRQSLEPESQQLGIYVAPKHGVIFSRRGEEGKRTHQVALTETTAPIWLKVTRCGKRFNFFTSDDGAEWAFRRGEEFLDGEIYIGLAGCSHDRNKTADAVFENVLLIKR